MYKNKNQIALNENRAIWQNTEIKTGAKLAKQTAEVISKRERIDKDDKESLAALRKLEKIFEQRQAVIHHTSAELKTLLSKIALNSDRKFDQSEFSSAKFNLEKEIKEQEAETFEQRMKEASDDDFEGNDKKEIATIIEAVDGAISKNRLNSKQGDLLRNEVLEKIGAAGRGRADKIFKGVKRKGWGEEVTKAEATAIFGFIWKRAKEIKESELVPSHIPTMKLRASHRPGNSPKAKIKPETDGESIKADQGQSPEISKTSDDAGGQSSEGSILEGAALEGTTADQCLVEGGAETCDLTKPKVEVSQSQLDSTRKLIEGDPDIKAEIDSTFDNLSLPDPLKIDKPEFKKAIVRQIAKSLKGPGYNANDLLKLQQLKKENEEIKKRGFLKNALGGWGERLQIRKQAKKNPAYQDKEKIVEKVKESFEPIREKVQELKKIASLVKPEKNQAVPEVPSLPKIIQKVESDEGKAPGTFIRGNELQPGFLELLQKNFQELVTKKLIEDQISKLKPEISLIADIEIDPASIDTLAKNTKLIKKLLEAVEEFKKIKDVDKNSDLLKTPESKKAALEAFGLLTAGKLDLTKITVVNVDAIVRKIEALKKAQETLTETAGKLITDLNAKLEAAQIGLTISAIPAGGLGAPEGITPDEIKKLIKGELKLEQFAVEQVAKKISELKDKTEFSDLEKYFNKEISELGELKKDKKYAKYVDALPKYIAEINPQLIKGTEIQFLALANYEGNLKEEVMRLIIEKEWEAVPEEKGKQSMKAKAEKVAESAGLEIGDEGKFLNTLAKLKPEEIKAFEVNVNKLIQLLGESSIGSFKDPAIRKAAIAALAPGLVSTERIDNPHETKLVSKLNLTPLIEENVIENILIKIKAIEEAKATVSQKAKQLAAAAGKLTMFTAVIPEAGDFSKLAEAKITAENIKAIIDNPQVELEKIALEAVREKIAKSMEVTGVTLPENLTLGGLTKNIEAIHTNYEKVLVHLESAIGKANEKLAGFGVTLPSVKKMGEGIKGKITAEDITAILKSPNKVSGVLVKILNTDYEDLNIGEVEELETKLVAKIEALQQKLDDLIEQSLEEGIPRENGELIKMKAGYKLTPEKKAAIRKKLIPCLSEFFATQGYTAEGKSLLGKNNALNLSALQEAMKSNPEIKELLTTGDSKKTEKLRKNLGEYIFKSDSPAINEMKTELMECFDMKAMTAGVFKEIRNALEKEGSILEKIFGVFTILFKYIGAIKSYFSSKLRSLAEKAGPLFEKAEKTLGEEYTPDFVKKWSEKGRFIRFKPIAEALKIEPKDYQKLYSLKMSVDDLLQVNPDKMGEYIKDGDIKLNVNQMKDLRKKLADKNKAGGIEKGEENLTVVEFLSKKFKESEGKYF